MTWWNRAWRRNTMEEQLAKGVSIEEHPKRPHQKLMLFELNGYIWAAPYVGTGDDIFLKTLFPSRMYTKKWIRGELR